MLNKIEDYKPAEFSDVLTSVANLGGRYAAGTSDAARSRHTVIFSTFNTFCRSEPD